MDKLLRERKALDARIERVKQNVYSLSKKEGIDEIDIQAELDNLLEMWASYLSVHKRMVDSCSDDQMDEILDHQCGFEKTFIALKTALMKLQKKVDF